MRGSALFQVAFRSSPAAAASGYGIVVLAFLWVIASAITDLLARYDQLHDAGELLAQFEGRAVRPDRRGEPNLTGPGGSAFLEGKTVTLAGAALVQRVVGAVTKTGGNVLSTEVELQGNHSKAGFISVVTSCEIEQPALQQLLYDLEAGLPFLFVEQLLVETFLTVTTTPPGKLRISLTVSGQWQERK
ncbi:type II secretion system protein GspM [Bradyrhizobium sp. CCBAU 11361]|uniref:type II secretion system protein GspM n=1 Tax=Bradyrhizobium sp. CCBAU 11361 TaxID=1630812 RepID=UPI002303EC03|nr:type II secretion system protein GspM [Bradyrhizobium sp. CCBAU 11361]MDA9489230.1 general secretion pathway protein GspM [Bradyrhizobium sp. CCBAU 11361]